LRGRPFGQVTFRFSSSHWSSADSFSTELKRQSQSHRSRSCSSLRLSLQGFVQRQSVATCWFFGRRPLQTIVSVKPVSPVLLKDWLSSRKARPAGGGAMVAGGYPVLAAASGFRSCSVHRSRRLGGQFWFKWRPWRVLTLSKNGSTSLCGSSGPMIWCWAAGSLPGSCWKLRIVWIFRSWESASMCNPHRKSPVVRLRRLSNFLKRRCQELR